MSYYFAILSPTDTPIFNIAFGTSKGGGDGIARFRFPDTAQYMNQFIIHSSLDIVEEAQWTNGGMYVSLLLSTRMAPISNDPILMTAPDSRPLANPPQPGTSSTSTLIPPPQPTSPPSSHQAAPAFSFSTNLRNYQTPAAAAAAASGPRPC